MAIYRSKNHISKKLTKIEEIFKSRINEVLASLVEQDLTFTAKAGSGIDGNLINIIYIGGGTQGAEGISVVDNDIEVTIEDGVSQATDIKAALDGNPAAAALIDITISGVAANPQSIFAPADPKFLEGGVSEVIGKKNAFVFRYKKDRIRIDGKDMTNVNFQANAGADITFDYSGSSYTIVKNNITAINRLRTRRYLVDVSQVAIV